MAYGVFGALQVLTRLYWGWRTSSRMRQMLKDMPVPGLDKKARNRTPRAGQSKMGGVLPFLQ